MIKVLAILLPFLFITDGHAIFEFDSGANLWTGKVRADEGTIDHKGYQFGFEISFAPVVNLSIFKVGYLVNLGALHIDSETNGDGAGQYDGAADYDNTMFRFMRGWRFGIPFEFGYTLFEYYTQVETELNYAEPKPSNLFLKDSRLSGKGWGVGLEFKKKKDASWGIMYREITFDRVKTADVRTDLPNSRFGEYKSSEIVFTMTKDIDFWSVLGKAIKSVTGGS